MGRRLLWVAGWALVTASCAHNSVNLVGDGRLFLLVDMPPRVSGGTIRVRAEIENEEPVELVICSEPETNPAPLCRLAANPRAWADVQNRSFDLLGKVIDGGSEVRFFVRDNEFDENQTTFELDGNTTIRLFMQNPELAGSRHVEIELTVQQALF